MTTDPLATWTAAWQNASAGAHLPTLGDMQKHGADIQHAGVAVLGHVETKYRSGSAKCFVVLEAGPEHESLGGYAMAGQRIDEIVHPAHTARLNELYAEIVETKTLHRWHCVNMARNADPISYTRVLVPIADDVGDGRCLAGQWVWHVKQGNEDAA